LKEDKRIKKGPTENDSPKSYRNYCDIRRRTTRGIKRNVGRGRREGRG
jgi:hypothetical protein